MRQERRRPSNGLILVVFGVAVLLLAARQHLAVAYKILSVYATWHLRSDVIAAGISYRRDAFDQSFRFYARNQTSATEPPLFDMRHPTGAIIQPNQDLIPANLHHILIGMDWDTAPQSWHQARNSCLAYHPTYTAYFWDDARAEDFLQREYPWFLETWLGYKFVIQRADSLRYFVLYHYGGVFLDLDLTCRRSLAPLRRFPSVAIAATPAGVSNGFLMASARHPFFEQLIHALPRYNLNWVHSYLSIMLSTGPMFLSAEILRYRDPQLRLRYLTGHYHHLSGKVVTPLFAHGGASSWHQNDTILFKRVVKQIFSFPTFVSIFSALLFIYAIWQYLASRRHTETPRFVSERPIFIVPQALPVWIPFNYPRSDDEEALPLYAGDCERAEHFSL